MTIFHYIVILKLFKELPIFALQYFISKKPPVKIVNTDITLVFNHYGPALINRSVPLHQLILKTSIKIFNSGFSLIFSDGDMQWCHSKDNVQEMLTRSRALKRQRLVRRRALQRQRLGKRRALQFQRRSLASMSSAAQRFVNFFYFMYFIINPY